MQQENTYIRCIKCWVKSFNLAPYIFVFYIYKLQYDRRYIILNNKLNIPITHTLPYIHGLEPTVFLIFNVRLQSYIYRTIDKPLCFVILIGFTTWINKKCCKEFTPISTTDSRGIFYDLWFSFGRRGKFHWNDDTISNQLRDTYSSISA